MSSNPGFSSILLPLDGSELAEQALTVAAGLARDAGVVLHIVAVHEPVSVPYAAEFPVQLVAFDAETRKGLETYLARVANLARTQGAPDVRTALLDGLAAHELRQYIQDGRIGLVVMTSHGRGGLGRLWLGSVTDRLLRTAGVPILVLKPNGKPRLLSCRRILLALDGEIEQEVVEAGLGLQTLMPGASLLLTRIVEPPAPGLTRLAVQSAAFAADWTERHETEATNYLARLAERIRTPTCKVETHTLVGHPVAAKIIALALAAKADLVVIGTHGFRGVERLLLGSVADKIIRISDLPVLVVPVHRPAAARRVAAA